ncbi:LysM peptidoglycan-binding domain-containing protein [Dyadobacter psychrotolerans]|uniref:LysM peptidoglycan-binding domain-containing protein n=1 Tax=Dyadobacter psychrotolerans TaxID=2541721 RepID=A0A4R5DQX5_9BACT|nr:LysM peptidoglycan-binding domain-containing protein [Dyadobacter psychrotolerans]TDE16699.1 LysM peptidoglycan-binding domain-containing protein [Dyadobacter psychrotolerans]
MIRIFIKKHKVATLLWVLLFSFGYKANSQGTPEIPASVSFGGISVKFDRSAQNLIEEDIKNLMSNKKFWEEKMERAILYFPIVESILMDEEVPIDFKYLAVQESSFKPDVVSSSNAVGYWQFKPETARGLNLRVDNEVDERKNISSSTHAAAWYLKKSNQQFNNWVSSLYSYYLGAGGVKKIVPANWAYAREITLTGKTDRYMLRFFAHKIALEAGIERLRSTNKIVLLESEYGKGQTFDEIAKTLGVNSKELESYNRWVTNGRIPTDREYLITVPVPTDQIAAVREKLALPAQTGTVAGTYADTGFPMLKKSDVNSKDGRSFYEINGLPGIEARPGDKPITLAKAGKLRTPKFMRYNDMVKDMPLIPGNVYYLSRKNKKAATPFHTARPGDTWHSVSQQYGLRLVSLLNYNRTLSRNYPIQTGQVLFLTKKRPKKQPIEIIKPGTPAVPTETSPVVASASTPAVSDAIPDKPSGRKKYTPVLVDKSESSIAKENQQFEPAVTPQVTIPVVTTQPGAAASETNDRVVIITQDNTESNFRSGEGNTPAVKKSDRSTTIADTKPAVTPTAANSVYARKKREAAERATLDRAAAEKTVTAERPVTTETAVSNVGTKGYHTVKSGETYFSIAKKYGMDLSELTELNSAGGRKSLMVGQKLKVIDGTGSLEENSNRTPVAVATPTGPTRIEREAETIVTTRNEASRSGAEYHTVQAGQTYYSIARTYGISLNELMILNNMSSPGKLVAGQQLRVSKNGSRNTVSPVSGQGAQIHIVSAGETLFRIAQTYGASIEEIKRLNNMSGNNVVVGQKLKIPQKQ